MRRSTGRWFRNGLFAALVGAAVVAAMAFAGEKALVDVRGRVMWTESGLPASGLEVIVRDSSTPGFLELPEHAEIWRGTTGVDGTFQLTVPIQDGLLVEVPSVPCAVQGSRMTVGEARPDGPGHYRIDAGDLTTRALHCPR